MSVHIPFPERITRTIGEACAATGLGRTKLYELIKGQRVARTKVGARTLMSNRSSLLWAHAGSRIDHIAPNSHGSADPALRDEI
jgi:hypothetical protein